MSRLNWILAWLISVSSAASLCFIERQIKQNTYAIEQLNMRLGLVEAVQKNARHSYEQALMGRANRNTNYTVIESEPR